MGRRPRDLVLYCNHCGRGEGDVPCISVKYLIYLNINKIKLFVKFLFSAAVLGPGLGQNQQSLVWRQPPACRLGGPRLSVVRGLPLLFPGHSEAAVSSWSVTTLGPEHHEDQ